MNFISLIRSDIAAKAEWNYGRATGGTVLKTLLTDGTAAMILFRLMEASQRVKLTPLAMLFNKLNTLFGQCIIGRGVTFGPGFVLIHSQGVVINTAVHGGGRIRIEHQVTIGAEKGAAPVLGDDIFIGAGAKVIGGVRIGSGVKIGANAVVVQSAPDGATMVGVPAKAIERPER